MSFAASDDQDIVPYVHEETGEERHPKEFHAKLNRSGWEGEQISDDATVWRITAPEEAAGIWRKRGAGNDTE
jgi:hypothetical protein